jgi:hypothetical protein
VPIIARIVWEEDGEEHIDTEAAGWSPQLVYVRLPDRRYRLTSVWLDIGIGSCTRSASKRLRQSRCPLWARSLRAVALANPPVQRVEVGPRDHQQTGSEQLVPRVGARVSGPRPGEHSRCLGE